MRLVDYLHDHLTGVVACLVADGLLALMLRAHGLDGRVVGAAIALVTGCALVALGADYLRRRRFFGNLSATLDALDEKYLVAEVIDPPSTREGRFVRDALARACKSMADEVAAQRAEQRAYRDYVEAWVHEVKTPIAAARLVAQNHPSPETRAMEREVQRIQGFAEQALYYARSTSLDRDFTLREVVLADVVRDAVRRNARALIDARVTPELGDLGQTVRCDPRWTAFVIGQLLVNAAAYRAPAPDGGELPPATVRIWARQVGTGLDARETVLSVADDGIGIPAQDLDRVFDRGFTGVNGRSRARSTGMGLYLVRTLCEKMGLSVSLTSEVGAGTCVRIAFPDATVTWAGREP